VYTDPNLDEVMVSVTVAEALLRSAESTEVNILEKVHAYRLRVIILSEIILD